MRRISLALIAIAIASQLLSPITASAQGGYASAPRDVTTTAISGGIRIAWSIPADIDSGILGYRIEYSTSGNSGTWEYQTTVGGSTYTYDFVGLNQVAIYIRIAATTNAGVGSYGYPWTKIYGTYSTNRNSLGNIDYESGFGLGAGQASATYASSNFTRIRYLLNTTVSGSQYYADSDFYKWSRSSTSIATSRTNADPSIASVMVPTLNSPNSYLIQANVTDLNIYSTSPSVTRTVGSVGANGRLEIWPYNYGPELSSLSDGSTGGNSSTYDFNDTPDTSNSGTYGSFQLHDMTNYKPVFVWNNTGYGATAEIAYGRNTGTHPDWTFCSGGQGSCPTPSSFRLQIYVNIPVTPLADVTGPTISRIDGRTLAKNGDTITVRSTEVGTVYLVNQTISVNSISSINAAAAANKNSVSISAANTNTVMTISALNSGTYNLYGADLFNNLSSGIIGTIRIDNTAPTAASIAVSASGTSILLTASETITNSAQIYGTYTISDSGSALSVTSTTFSGLVATLNLSRAIPAGAIVYFAYAPSTGAADGRWIDQAGNEMAAIATRVITNNSISSISVTLTVPTSISKGASTTISVSVSVAGKVTFFLAGKRIAGCLNKSASGTTPITVSCTFKPALTARQIIKATLVPTLGSYPTTAASVERFILKRSTLR